MDAVSALLDGFAAAAQPENLLWAFVGVMLGTFVGVLPGIGPAMTLALLLPLTYSLDPAPALILFAGIYYGGMYGGSTTSILLNAPGESSSVMTAIEGNKMARAGRGAQALATAAIGSFVAGTIATVLLIFTAPAMASFAVSLKAQDYFAITLLSFVAVSTVLGSSPVRGLAALALGLTLGLIGIDSLTGQQRLTFGIDSLSTGIDTVVVAVALFAVGEALWIAAHLRQAPAEVMSSSTPWMSRSDWRRSWPAWLRGTALGFPFGALPAGGAEMPTFLSYSLEKKLTRHPEEFGHGAIEGVAGPEAANNASAAGTLVTLLALGIPTTATAAVMLSAFSVTTCSPVRSSSRTPPSGVGTAGQPAHRQRDAAGAQPAAGAPVGPAAHAAAALPLQRHPVLLDPGKLQRQQNPTDILVLVVLGLLGFLMRRYGLPVAPTVIGVILGPTSEGKLRQALQVSNGDWSTLWATVFSIIMYVVIAALLTLAAVRAVAARRASASEDTETTERERAEV